MSDQDDITPDTIDHLLEIRERAPHRIRIRNGRLCGTTVAEQIPDPGFEATQQGAKLATI